MRYVKTKDLKPNMVLASTLYDDNENVLLRANNKLTRFYIEKIGQYGYDGLYVFENDDVCNNPIISEETRIKTMKCLKRLQIEDCLFLANKIVEEIKESETTIVEMINLSSYDNYTYVHSINVDILSVMLGIGLGLRDEELRQLSQAALLHDIGKTCIDIELLNKPGKLTEEEYREIQNHSLYGYNMTKENENISSVVRNAIYSHHENEDGTGYPRQLTSDKIHKFAKIIHVADVYDALTAKRVYKDAMNPGDALEYLMANSGRMFDATLIGIFMRYIALYPVGTTVRLSNGRKATVLKNHETFLGRPVVKMRDGTVIDLMQKLDITITKLLTK